MAEPHVVSALVAKRAEIAGEIHSLERRLAQLRADLIHIDAALVVFDPDAEPATIAPKRPVRRSAWFAAGELSRLALEMLRRAGDEPLSTREIARRVMAARGLNEGDERSLRLIEKRVWNYLRRRAGGLVEIAGKEGRCAVWRVAR